MKHMNNLEDQSQHIKMILINKEVKKNKRKMAGAVLTMKMVHIMRVKNMMGKDMEKESIFTKMEAFMMVIG
jgi:hypothetical protein